MALQERINPLSVPANADLSASQFCFVAVNSSGRLILPATAGDDCIGVLQDKPAAAGRAGEVALLQGSGRLKVVAGASLTPGNKVQANTSGHAIVAASGGVRSG